MPSTPRRHGADVVQDGISYFGRFTLGQWREYLEPETPQRAPSRSLSPSRSRQTSAPCSEMDVDEDCDDLDIGLDAWLLVLLMSDACAMACMACSCRKWVFPYSQSGSMEVEMEARPDVPLGLVERAAWLRCGMSQAFDRLPMGVQEAGLPPQLRTWAEVLWHQETAGDWLCMVCTRVRAQLAQDFPSAVNLVGDWEPSEVASPTVLILPSARTHVSDHVCVSIRRPLGVVGLVLPSPGPSRPVLRLHRLNVACPPGTLVEIRDLIIMGGGNSAGAPRGVCDSAVHVSSGRCIIMDSEVRIAQGCGGFGIAVGRALTPGCIGGTAGSASSGTGFPPSLTAELLPRAVLVRTEVKNCCTGCTAYLGGQLVLSDQSSVKDCDTGVVVCGAECSASVDSSCEVLCTDGMDFKEVSGGVIRRGLSTVESS